MKVFIFNLVKIFLKNWKEILYMSQLINLVALIYLEERFYMNQYSKVILIPVNKKFKD